MLEARQTAYKYLDASIFCLWNKVEQICGCPTALAQPFSDTKTIWCYIINRNSLKENLTLNVAFLWEGIKLLENCDTGFIFSGPTWLRPGQASTSGNAVGFSERDLPEYFFQKIDRSLSTLCSATGNYSYILRKLSRSFLFPFWKCMLATKRNEMSSW